MEHPSTPFAIQPFIDVYSHSTWECVIAIGFYVMLPLEIVSEWTLWMVSMLVWTSTITSRSCLLKTQHKNYTHLIKSLEKEFYYRFKNVFRRHHSVVHCTCISQAGKNLALCNLMKTFFFLKTQMTQFGKYIIYWWNLKVKNRTQNVIIVTECCYKMSPKRTLIEFPLSK